MSARIHHRIDFVTTITHGSAAQMMSGGRRISSDGEKMFIFGGIFQHQI